MKTKCGVLRVFAIVFLFLAAVGGAVEKRKNQIRLGVCDWTIEKAGDPAALGLAKKLGLAGLQVTISVNSDTLPLLHPKLQKAYLDSVKQTGVGIASFCIGQLNSIPYKSDPRAEKWLDQSIGICKTMGVGIILVPFFGKGDLLNDPQGMKTVVARLKRVAPKAEKAGVVLALESQLSAEDCLKIIKQVGSPAVKVYYDVANSQKMGYPIFKEIRLLGKSIAQIHAKDSKDLYGKGSMDFPAVRKAMEDIGYSGWLVMEGTKMPLGIEESNRYDANYLKTLFPVELK